MFINHTLSEKQIATLELGESRDPSKYITYRILNNSNNEVVFIGRLFFRAEDQQSTIYLNDILESLKDNTWYNATNILDPSGIIRGEFIIHTSNIKFEPKFEELENGVWKALGATYPSEVILVHPRRNSNVPEYAIRPSMLLDSTIYPMLPMLSGCDAEIVGDRTFIKTGLTPIIPTTYIDFGQLLNTTEITAVDSFDIALGTFDGDTFNINETLSIEPDSYKGTYVYDYSMEDMEAGDTLYMAAKSTKTGDFDIFIPMYKIDTCDSRFYLRWFDRLGGIQMQPFNKGSKRTTDYEYTNKRNQYDEANPIHIKTNDTYEINTGWISEDILPFYEDIFVSPFLVLYDSKTDETFTVIVKDREFEYKTFQNQGRRMFNMHLALETAEKENIIY